MKPFQVIVIIIFLAAGVIALLMFAGVIKIGDQSTNNSKARTIIRIWGTLSPERLGPIIQKFNEENQTYEIRYAYRSGENFGQDLLESIASGTGPDLFLLPDSLAYLHRERINPVPYASFPIANFKGSFGSAGDVYLTSKGILGLPIVIDPLVMYYNRTILDSNGIVYAPEYWDEFGTLVPKIIQKDAVSNQISRSAVALGQFSNVKNAKDILSALFMQSGNKIVVESDLGYFMSALDDTEFGESSNKSLAPVLNFYTSFANPLNPLYSWNKSLPASDLFFTSDKLAFYFGYASESNEFVRRNPNLNFGVAPIPQVKGAKFKATKARVYGISVASSSKNATGAFAVANILASGSSFGKEVAEATSMPPARRDLLATKGEGRFDPIFYNTALYAKSWLDPSPTGTNQVFQDMVESVLSNSKTAADAMRDADGQLNILLRR